MSYRKEESRPWNGDDAEAFRRLKAEETAERNCLGQTPSQAREFDAMCEAHDAFVENEAERRRVIDALRDAVVDARSSQRPGPRAITAEELEQMDKPASSAWDLPGLRNRIKLAKHRFEMENALSECLAALLGCREVLGNIANVPLAIEMATAALEDHEIDDEFEEYIRHHSKQTVECIPGGHASMTPAYQDEVRFIRDQVRNACGVSKEYLRAEARAEPAFVFKG